MEKGDHDPRNSRPWEAKKEKETDFTLESTQENEALPTKLIWACENYDRLLTYKTER